MGLVDISTRLRQPVPIVHTLTIIKLRRLFLQASYLAEEGTVGGMEGAAGVEGCWDG